MGTVLPSEQEKSECFRAHTGPGRTMRKKGLAREAVGGAGLQAICLSKGGLGLGECLGCVEAKQRGWESLGKRSSSSCCSAATGVLCGEGISLAISCISSSRGSGLHEEGCPHSPCILNVLPLGCLGFYSLVSKSPDTEPPCLSAFACS